MSENDNIYYRCKEQSKVYLKCRMDRNLMAQEDLTTMGFGKDANVVPSTTPTQVEATDESTRARKRIAGMSHLGAMKKRWSWLGFGQTDSSKGTGSSKSSSGGETT